MSEQVKRYSLSEFAERYTHPIGPGTYVGDYDYDALHAEAEARLEREQIALAHAMDAASEAERLRTELEAARGLLERVTRNVPQLSGHPGLLSEIDDFLTATPAPEVPDHLREPAKMDEHGERQDAVAWMLADAVGGSALEFQEADLYDLQRRYGGQIVPLYTTPQPGPGVRWLVEALEHYAGCGKSGNVARVALAAHRQAQQGEQL